MFWVLLAFKILSSQISSDDGVALNYSCGQLLRCVRCIFILHQRILIISYAGLSLKLLVYHNSSLHVVNRKLDVTAHRMHHMHRFGRASCPAVPQANYWISGTQDEGVHVNSQKKNYLRAI
ncbi:hypothetical protein ACH5RR_039460 [Cinchona calisaya]|uniref:Secreted protein n=1 Tax=Cinchona calisaya TaxID=153742 RepID=A0ABD2XYA4_9GENT